MESKLTRRTFVKRTAAIAIASAGGGATIGTPSSPVQGVNGPLVYLDYDQTELDAAYSQLVWAPNMDRVLSRRRPLAEAALLRIGKPERLAYGENEFERLDLYRTDRAKAPIHIYIHGGAWRGGMDRAVPPIRRRYL